MISMGLLPELGAAQNLVDNGNFETQYFISRRGFYMPLPPTQLLNIKPLSVNSTPGVAYADELPKWNALGDLRADFLATNSLEAVVNPQGSPRYGAFTPHSGGGCVGLFREPGSSTASGAQAIVQQLVGLEIGRAYDVSFYALRRPGARWVDRLAARISATVPSIGGPSNAYAAVVSPPIADHLNWTLVTGTFTAQGTTAFLTIGYDTPPATPDASLYSVDSKGVEYYVVDDVEVKPAICHVPSPSLSVTGPNGPAQSQDEFCRTAVFDCAVSNIAGATYQWSINGLATWPNGYTITPGTNGYTCQVSVTQPWTPPQIQPIFDIVCEVNAPGACHPVRVRLNDLRMRTDRDCMGSSGLEVRTATAYPNPVADQLVMPAAIQQAQLFDNRGKLRRTYLAEPAKKTLDVKDLPAGLYQLRLMQLDGRVTSQRLEIQH